MILVYFQDSKPQQMKAQITCKYFFKKKERKRKNNRCAEPLCGSRGTWACAALLLV